MGIEIAVTFGARAVGSPSHKRVSDWLSCFGGRVGALLFSEARLSTALDDDRGDWAGLAHQYLLSFTLAFAGIGNARGLEYIDRAGSGRGRALGDFAMDTAREEKSGMIYLKKVFQNDVYLVPVTLT